MPLPFTTAPRSVCLLRLSAVGDISHTLPVVRTLQATWPETRITWIIGRLEHTLVGDIPGIEFIIFDKSKRWRALVDIRRQLKGRRFDLLLHMQMSLRASLITTQIRADIRLGFDRQRAKDLQWLFSNARIPYRPHQHVVDSLLGFAEAAGATRRELRWDIPLPDSARAFANERLPAGLPLLVISPCSSMAYRNWTVAGYAAVADHAMRQHGMVVVLTGGPSALEHQVGEAISAQMAIAPLNLIGQTDLKQLLAVLDRAEALIAPDSGPAHLATAVGTPVVGLYAATNPDRARPYLSGDYVVNRYPEAVEAHYGKPVDQLPWGTRVRAAGTMARITPAEVCATLDRLLAARGQRR